MWLLRGVGVLAVASAGMLEAQDGGPVASATTVLVDAPKLGHFYDSGRRQLQSLIGIPGSGFPGSVLDSGAGSPLIEVAPSQDYALLLLPDTGRLAVMRLDVPAPAPAPVAGVLEEITNISISPGSSVALIYSAISKFAQVVTELPENPSVRSKLDWSMLPGRITALAIDDAGERILAASQSSDGAVLYVISADGVASGIYTAQTISSLTFFRNSREALAAAPADGQVIWIRDSGGLSSPVVLANAASGMTGPRFVEGSQDGLRAIAVDSAGGVFTIPLAGGPSASVACGCQPAQLRRMRGRDVFLLTSATPGLVFVDAGGEAPNVVLMPDARGPAARSGDSR